MIKYIFIITIIDLVILLPVEAAASVVYFETDNYRSRAGNPFLSDVENGAVFVEDFETEPLAGSSPFLLSSPNVTGWNGLTSGSTKAGVQEDYSEAEPLGYRWSNAGFDPENQKSPQGIHFDFSPDSNGRLPEYAGAALRGSTILGTDPSFNIILVYDTNGVEVTNGEWKIPKPVTDPPPPMEDLFLNFYGIYVPGGISRILFRDFREVDHLTYGYSAIPEPAVTGLAAATLLGLGLSRRRRQT